MRVEIDDRDAAQVHVATTTSAGRHTDHTTLRWRRSVVGWYTGSHDHG